MSPAIRLPRGSRFWTILVVAPALVGVACATTPDEPDVTIEDVEAVQERVEDVERTNGRLTVRVEEMERQMALVQDRVDSNRIALQRRGYLRGQGDRFAHAPDQQGDAHSERPGPAPESHYQGQGQQQGDEGYRADPTMQQRMDQRGYRRIPLSDQQSGHQQQPQQHQPQQQRTPEDPAGGHLDYDPGDSDSEQPASDGEEIVITNETLEERFGPSSSSPEPQQESQPSQQQDQQPQAHEPVTSERLPTSDELEYDPSEQQQPQEEQAEQSADDDADDDPLEGLTTADGSPVNEVDVERWVDASDDSLLELYQDALSEYRHGDYSSALEGFTEFLGAGPRDDYVDNALYWIGECHYGLGEYQTSVQYFERIIDELSNADKVPDAMLKKSLAYDRMGKSEESVDLLEQLVDQYPNSNPGRLGKERLEEKGHH